MPRTRPPERREVDEGEEGEADEVEAEAAVLAPPAAPAPPALPEGDAAAWLANAQQQIALQLSHQLAHSLAQNQQTQQLWLQQALATNNQQQQQQLLTAIAQLQPAAGAAPAERTAGTPTMGAATSTRPPHTLLAADLSAQQFLGIDQAQGSPAASVTSAADTDAARIADIQTTLAKAIGNADQTLRCDPTTCNLSTELWRVTTTLLRNKKLDAGELSQFNTIIGAARCFLRLLETYSFDQESDDAIGEILERCTRDIMRIHIRASPLLKTKEQAEQLYLAACAKRDGVSGENAIAGVAICMPEMAEIHAKLQRDFDERCNKLLQRTGRKARSDDDDEEDDDVKKKADKQTADKHAAELKSRDKKIGELVRALREHDLPLPPKAAKKNGTATKGGKSKDREPAAADDGDEE